jgi:hypothetical protein
MEKFEMKGRRFIKRKTFRNTFEFRLEGNAKFTFPSGTTYVGEFKDGEFDGHGILHYANGAKYDAIWEKGVAKEVSDHFLVHLIISNNLFRRVNIHFLMV